MEKISSAKSFENNLIEKEFEKNSFITTIYVLILFGVFPLVFHNYYFDILTFKYQFFYILTAIYIVSIIFNKIRCTKKISIKNYVKNLSMPAIFILIFMFIAILSTLQSDYIYESFWGNEGRYTGCFTLLLYCTSFLLVYKYFRFNKFILYVFLISGILVCWFGITDYFQLDILNFKVKMDPTQYNMFMSTIGNINTYTSYVALIMAVSSIMFAVEKVYWKMWFYFLCMISSFFAIIMGLSDNSYLSIMMLFGILPLYLFNTRTGFRRYLIIITTFTGTAYTIIIINKYLSDKVLKMQGILQELPQQGIKLFFLIMIGITVLVYIWSFLNKSVNDDLGKTWVKVWLFMLIFIAAALSFMLYDVNYNSNLNRYGSLREYLLFNDDWGTHRGYNWRIGLENYSRFSLIHKIFGYGPDTYGILTHFNNFKDMAAKYNETYDSAHNEYLQYFITMGPLSLISYLGFLCSSIICMAKKIKGNVYAASVIFAVICYCIQAFVNISVPIVTPIVFVLLASGLASIDKDFRYN